MILGLRWALTNLSNEKHVYTMLMLNEIINGIQIALKFNFKIPHIIFHLKSTQCSSNDQDLVTLASIPQKLSCD